MLADLSSFLCCFHCSLTPWWREFLIIGYILSFFFFPCNQNFHSAMVTPIYLFFFNFFLRHIEIHQPRQFCLRGGGAWLLHSFPVLLIFHKNLTPSRKKLLNFMHQKMRAKVQLGKLFNYFRILVLSSAFAFLNEQDYYLALSLFYAVICYFLRKYLKLTLPLYVSCVWCSSSR